MNVVTSLLGLVFVSHLSPKGSGRFSAESEPPVRGLPDSEQCLSGATPDCPVPQEDKAPMVETARTLTVG
jgi:hypothetical protein